MSHRHTSGLLLLSAILHLAESGNAQGRQAWIVAQRKETGERLGRIQPARIRRKTSHHSRRHQATQRVTVRRIERPGTEKQVACIHQSGVQGFDLLLIPSCAGVGFEGAFPAREERAEAGEGREGWREEDDEVGC